MSEEVLNRSLKSSFQYDQDASKQLKSSFIGLMQHRTNDLARFIEIKHRYWKLMTTQLPKNALQPIRSLFRSDTPLYLFKSFDANEDNPNQILNHLKPLFFTQQQASGVPAAQLLLQRHI